MSTKLIPGAVYYVKQTDGAEDWFMVTGKHRAAGTNFYQYTIESVRYGRQVHNERIDTTSRFISGAQRWDPTHDCLWSESHSIAAEELDEAAAAK